MSNISLEHYIGREVVKGTSGASNYITLDGDVKIYNEDDARTMEEIPKGSRLVLITMDKEDTQAIFQDAEGMNHPLTLTATKHALSDPERTDGEKVVLQGGVDSRDLSVPPEPSERDSEAEEHLAEAARLAESETQPQPAPPEPPPVTTPPEEEISEPVERPEGPIGPDGEPIIPDIPIVTGPEDEPELDEG